MILMIKISKVQVICRLLTLQGDWSRALSPPLHPAHHTHTHDFAKRKVYQGPPRVPHPFLYDMKWLFSSESPNHTRVRQDFTTVQSEAVFHLLLPSLSLRFSVDAKKKKTWKQR